MEPEKPLEFEAAVEQIDRILRQMEEGRLGLEEGLARYEQGIRLLGQCYAQLGQAEQKIRLLTGTDEAGNPTMLPFEHQAATSLNRGETSARRSRTTNGRAGTEY